MSQIANGTESQISVLRPGFSFHPMKRLQIFLLFVVSLFLLLRASFFSVSMTFSSTVSGVVGSAQVVVGWANWCCPLSPKAKLWLIAFVPRTRTTKYELLVKMDVAASRRSLWHVPTAPCKGTRTRETLKLYESSHFWMYFPARSRGAWFSWTRYRSCHSVNFASRGNYILFW